MFVINERNIFRYSVFNVIRHTNTTTVYHARTLIDLPIPIILLQVRTLSLVGMSIYFVECCCH